MAIRKWASAALLPAAAFVLAGAGIVGHDPLLEQRRANLPKTTPWPMGFFQPQAEVPGTDRPTELPVAAPADRTVSAKALADADAYAADVGSTAFLVYHKGKLQHAWYAPGTGAGTVGHTYTLHYAPVALLIGIAQAEGRLGGLDEPVVRYLPEWRDDPRAAITLRQLLQMNAGLDMRFDAHYSKGLYSRDARAYWGSRSTEVILNEYPLMHKPGTRFDYNYIVPVILGVILERATGRPYTEYLSEKLWKPLGNRSARVWLNRPGGEPHLDASLFAAPADWLNIGVMLLNRGKFGGKQIVPASFIDELRRPSATNPNWGFTYLGHPHAPVRRMATDERVTYVVKSSEPFDAEDTYYLDGYGGQRIYVVPSRDLVVVRVGEVARDKWDNSKLPNIVMRGIGAK